MKAQPDCIVCLFRQALNTARMITDDPDVHREILSRIARWVADVSLDDTPAGLSQPLYDVVRDVTGVEDPYASYKEESNRIALSMLADLEKRIAGFDDPMDAALHLAAAGNVIDAGVGHHFDIKKDIIEMLYQHFAINDITELKKELPGARTVLYLGDNAGEIVFDTLLIEQMLQKNDRITFSVKSGPIINDATMKDAETAGMTSLVKVIETGSNDIGVNFQRISEEFRNAFEKADVIISKGHGNFETCNDREENIYFLLKAKCPMVAAELGVSVGDIVFKHKPRGQRLHP